MHEQCGRDCAPLAGAHGLVDLPILVIVEAQSHVAHGRRGEEFVGEQQAVEAVLECASGCKLKLLSVSRRGRRVVVLPSPMLGTALSLGPEPQPGGIL